MRTGIASQRGSAAWLLGLAALVSGCGPYLMNVKVSRRAYRSSAECAQGPFEVHLKATGSRWGERFGVAIEAAHAVAGRYTLAVDGKPEQRGTFSSQFTVTESDGYGHPVSRSVADAHPDNKRCLERPAPEQLAAVSAPAAESSVVAPQAPPWEPPPGAVAVPMAPEPLEVPRGPAELQEIPGDGRASGAPHRAEVVTLERGNADPKVTSGPFTAGADILVTFWFDAPNDLAGAQVIATHDDLWPTDEQKWVAKLEQDAIDRARKQKERELEYKKEAKERQAEAERRVRWCGDHHDDEDCWGEGGYDGAVARQAQAEKEARERAAREAAAPPVVTVASARPPRVPDGPPPPARVETPPPRPSPHAEWVNGYWHRAGADWVWFEGWWRVPESDRLARQTLTAPSPPPAPQVEAVPPQRLGATWIGGSWSWDGRGWIWLPGRWSLPPAPGAAWLAPQWLRFGGGVRLEPGRWQVPAHRAAPVSR